MHEKIEEKVNKELYNDLSSIMNEEYEKRMLITPSYCANKLLEKGYRKESDTAREILTELLDFVNGWFEGVENNDFGVEFNRISKDIAEKCGVDLGAE